MHVFRVLSSGLALGCLLASSACHPQPVATASGEQSVFAAAYPARLNTVRDAFYDEEKRVRDVLPALRTPPAGLRGDERPAAKELFQRADVAGRSGYYADEALRQEAFDHLFDDGRSGLRRRVAGAVVYTVKQKKCGELDCSEELANELGNAAGYAADRAIERHAEQSLAAHNDASRYLETHSAKFGERNIDGLNKHTRILSRVSFGTHVRLELYRRELDGLLEERSRVSAALEREENEARAVLTEADLSKTQRTSLERQLDEAQAGRAALSKELPLAQSALDDMEGRIATLHKDYDAMLAALLAALDQAASATPEPGTPAPKATPGASGAAAPVDRNSDVAGSAR
jgi:hypothetical protein